MKLNIYQIYYQENQLSSLDPIAIPMNNIGASDGYLCEYPIFKRGVKFARSEGASHYGFLSPKFQQKSGYSVDEFKNIAEQAFKQNNADVVFINPKPLIESVFGNTFIQGERWHPGITHLANTILDRIGYKNIKVETFFMTNSIFAFCNYFIANERFWDDYFEFIDAFLFEVEKDPDFNTLMYKTSAKYCSNSNIPYFTFVIERLFSIFLFINQNKYVIAHPELDYDKMKHKLTQKQFAEMISLSYLKTKLTNNDIGLAQAWNTFLRMFLSANPTILDLE